VNKFLVGVVGILVLCFQGTLCASERKKDSQLTHRRVNSCPRAWSPAFGKSSLPTTFKPQDVRDKLDTCAKNINRRRHLQQLASKGAQLVDEENLGRERSLLEEEEVCSSHMAALWAMMLFGAQRAVEIGLVVAL